MQRNVRRLFSLGSYTCFIFNVVLLRICKQFDFWKEDLFIALGFLGRYVGPFSIKATLTGKNYNLKKMKKNKAELLTKLGVKNQYCRVG